MLAPSRRCSLVLSSLSLSLVFFSSFSSLLFSFAQFDVKRALTCARSIGREKIMHSLDREEVATGIRAVLPSCSLFLRRVRRVLRLKASNARCRSGLCKCRNNKNRPKRRCSSLYIVIFVRLLFDNSAPRVIFRFAHTCTTYTPFQLENLQYASIFISGKTSRRRASIVGMSRPYLIDYINKTLRMSQYSYYEGMSSKRSTSNVFLEYN